MALVGGYILPVQGLNALPVLGSVVMARLRFSGNETRSASTARPDCSEATRILCKTHSKWRDQNERKPQVAAAKGDRQTAASGAVGRGRLHPSID